MKRRLPPLNALVAFEAAARLGSFTRAGREIGVAQPAITRHVTNLEDWAGARLFERHGNRLTLTTAGEHVSELATAAFDRLELGLRVLPQSNARELVIGASFGVAHLLLIPRLNRLRMAAGLPVSILTSDDYRNFDAPDVHCSIRFGRGSFGSAEAELLLPERCQIIASPGFTERFPDFDPADPLGTLPPEAIFEHGDEFGAEWMTWERWYEAQGLPFKPHSDLHTVRSYPTMLEMICAGEGIGVGTIGLEDALVRSGDVIRLGPEVAREGMGYFLVWYGDLPNATGAEGLMSALID